MMILIYLFGVIVSLSTLPIIITTTERRGWLRWFKVVYFSIVLSWFAAIIAIGCYFERKRGNTLP